MTIAPPTGETIQDVVAMATAQRATLVTAESCTAGALATLIADTPGAGDVFAGGFVTYAKACKEAVLSVPAAMIEKETAVSADVALAMAQGALRSCILEDVSIAVTCVGGPKADDDGNPVGLAHIAVCDRDGAFARTSEIYTGAPSDIRVSVLADAICLLRTFLGTRVPR